MLACALAAGGCGDSQGGGEIAGGDSVGYAADSGADGGGAVEGSTLPPPGRDSAAQEASNGGGDTGGGPPDAGGSDAPPPASEASVDAGPLQKQALIWVWQNYSNTLSQLQANPMSFTHVSPTFYQVNYGYTSGVAQFEGSDNFDGMTSMQIAQQVHSMGLKIVPAVQAGAGNSGTDQGIQNIVSDSPSGAQQSFITSMVGEGVAKAYDGFNLDWEPGNIGYSGYGAQYVKFLSAFKSALNAKGMALSIDIGSWYVRQCQASNGDGWVDLVQLRQAVDQAIIMDYTGTFGAPPSSSCPAQPPMQQDCDSNFVVGANVMCNLPAAAVSIGMISGQTNSYLPQALEAVTMYGFPAVAVWPSGGNLDSSGIPQGGTWFTNFAQFLAQ
jgi:hypothetical protein